MAKEKKFITCDGNYAAAHVAYLLVSTLLFIPLLPLRQWQSTLTSGQPSAKEYVGETVKVTEMQSEGGAAGAVSRIPSGR